MTKSEKELAKLLLQNNHYLLKAINARGKEVYKIMKGRQVPVQYFTEATYRCFLNILKTDSKKRMTINLSAVRQLNGNSYIKKLYKSTAELKKITESGTAKNEPAKKTKSA